MNFELDLLQSMNKLWIINYELYLTNSITMVNKNRFVVVLSWENGAYEIKACDTLTNEWDKITSLEFKKTRDEIIDQGFNTKETKSMYYWEFGNEIWEIKFMETIEKIKSYILSIEEAEKEFIQTTELETEKKIVAEKKVVRKGVSEKAANEKKDVVEARKVKAANRASSKEIELNWLIFNIHTATYLKNNKWLDFKNIKAEKNAIEIEPWLYLSHKEIIDSFKLLLTVKWIIK